MMLVVMYSKGLKCLGLVRFVRGLEGIEGNNYFPTDVKGIGIGSSPNLLQTD